MRRTHKIIQASLPIFLLASLLAVNWAGTTRADTANAPSLVISQLKITSSNGQFITLHNTTGQTLDMSKYQLEYFNNYDLNKSTTSRLIALSGSVPPHGYFMVNDDSLVLCYRMAVDSVSLGFSSTAGLVEIITSEQTAPGGPVAPALQDYVGWSKTAANGAQTLPGGTGAFLQRQPADEAGNPVVQAPGAGSWQPVQPDGTDPCSLVSITTAPTVVASGLSQLLPASEPPATIVSVAADMPGQPGTGSLPAGDIGLMAPEVTELLPNPAGTGNDASSEFIELYNPNEQPFDLTGFALQTGTTSFHSYVIPGGTILPAHGFTAFYSSATGLSLSNSAGQAKLLDPFGNSISATAAYGTAKDGQAWALAKGKWYWTTQPTPGHANVIKQPPAKKAGKKAASKKIAGKVKGASAIKRIKPSSATDSAAGSDTGDARAPIHPWVLAIAGALALLYGAYEYRADLANYFYQLRRNLKAGRSGRA